MPSMRFPHHLLHYLSVGSLSCPWLSVKQCGFLQLSLPRHSIAAVLFKKVLRFLIPRQHLFEILNPSRSLSAFDVIEPKRMMVPEPWRMFHKPPGLDIDQPISE